MNKELDVIGLGANGIAQVVQLEQLPDTQRHPVCTPQHYQLFGGGAIGNTLTGLARLGMKTAYLGRIGGENFGIMLKQLCVQEGIDLSHCELLPNARTAGSWVMLDADGHRSCIFFPNVLSGVDERYIHANASSLKSCRFLHIECSAIPPDTLLTAVETAKASGAMIGVNFNVTLHEFVRTFGADSQDDLEELIFLSDLFLPCLQGAQELADMEDPVEAAASLRERYQIPRVVIVQGRSGCIATTAEDTFEHPGFHVNTLDISGSDEAFQAGMIFGLLNGWDMRETATFANACYALSSQQFGPRSGMYAEDVVREFLKT